MNDVVQAINDLTRVVIAMNPQFETKSDAIRKLHEAGVEPPRIAAILGMPSKDVSSVITRDRKKKAKGGAL